MQDKKKGEVVSREVFALEAREWIRATYRTQRNAAKELNISRKHLNCILSLNENAPPPSPPDEMMKALGFERRVKIYMFKRGTE